MRNAAIGLLIGIIAGIVLGTTVIAPRLALNIKQDIGLTDEPQPVPESEPAVSAEVPDRPEAGKPDAGKPANPDVTRINMASAYAGKLVSHGTLAKRLERTVWRISDGALDLRFHPPGAMVPDKEALDAVASGAVDAYFTDLDRLSDRNPALTLFAGPPFGTSVAAYLGWMTNGGGRSVLETGLAELGLNGLICGIVPNAGGGWFRKPLKTVDELKGLRIRATGVTASLYKALGADVSRFSFGETLIAMESGLVDGAELSAPNVDLALGAAFEGWTYYVPGWRTPAQVFTLLMAEAKWQGLSEVQRTQIATACGDNVRQAIADSESLQYEALRKIVKNGVNVTTWPTEIRDAMHKAWLAEAQENQKTNRIYSRALNSYRQFIKVQSVWEELTRPSPP